MAEHQVDAETLMAEHAEIESTFLALRFAQQVRHTSLSCWNKCTIDKIKFPFRVDQFALLGKEQHCFADCLNVNFEKGPFLKELGAIPEGAIPKKFIWSHGLWMEALEALPALTNVIYLKFSKL